MQSRGLADSTVWSLFTLGGCVMHSDPLLYLDERVAALEQGLTQPTTRVVDLEDRPVQVTNSSSHQSRCGTRCPPAFE